MYAVIETGGHQMKVSQGDVITLEGKECKVGDQLTFDRVLAVDGKIGTPTVAGATVKGEVVFAGKGEKIYIQKYKARKRTAAGPGSADDLQGQDTNILV